MRIREDLGQEDAVSKKQLRVRAQVEGRAQHAQRASRLAEDDRSRRESLQRRSCASSIRRSSRTTAASSTSRTCTSSTSRNAATRRASPRCSCTAARAAAPIRRCAASSIRSAIASCCSISAARGKSRPHASLDHNTTWDLVADTESCASISASTSGWCSAARGARRWRSPTRRRIRSACTELVLRGIFLLRRSELEWFYQNPLGAGVALSRTCGKSTSSRFPEAERGDMMAAYYKRLTSPDPEVLRAPRDSVVGVGRRHELPAARTRTTSRSSAKTRRTPARSRASSATTS